MKSAPAGRLAGKAFLAKNARWRMSAAAAHSTSGFFAGLVVRYGKEAPSTVSGPKIAHNRAAQALTYT